MSVQTVSYEELDRLFYEKLRLACIDAGLTVDATLFTGPTAAEDYSTAKATLKATLISQGLALVEVIGEGTWDDRDEKSDGRIVINRENDSPGGIGGGPTMFYTSKFTAGVASFDKYRYPDTSTNVNYEVRIISNEVKLDRILSKIVDNILGGRRYLPTVDDTGAFTTTNVMVIRQGSSSISDQRYKERVYRFVVEDVFIQEPELVLADIPQLTTIHYCVYLSPTPVAPAADCIDVVTSAVTNNSGFPYHYPF